ncbi:MAG: TonB-dependent siderophore receptor [Gammaproteobacteria bacterium]|nr:TonB-dependent siderophore receptor [Gammaproteobacteria bacterium]MBU1556266.1 TonB-dependent siderophore receptor [Gammaproteobacteria bacterium]MBU2071494.1 TonB-dependent siderophore receptor [Gammaproteobacteria bacterium]MBU2181514.1 TonB-dependent siderophore receptor [Gammaproteobacteria bacterium]MBU2203740.1 TonB-dependent siderophore receptor [Gammaproteobacteria bacterium]
MQYSMKKLKLALAVQLACLPAAALADVAKQDEQAVETITVRGQYTVNETIDTATGLGLTLLETPQSVSVMTAQRIKDLDISSIADAVTQTPGLTSKAFDSTRNTFSARGFDIDKFQLDGVPMAWSLAGDSGETITDVAIYERIEVVRGATGLLTGVGEPSASINLVRKHANARELSGSINGGIGSWNKRFVTTDVTTPLSADGNVRARIVAKKELSDSFRDLAEEDKTVLYGVLDADLSDGMTLSLGSSYQDNNPTASTWGALPPLFNDDTPTNWDISTTTAAHWTRWDSTAKNHFASLTQQFNNGWQLKVNLNHNKNTADTRLLYIYGAASKDSGEGLYAWPYNSEGFSKQTSVDIQLQGSYSLLGREHEFVVGALQSRQQSEVQTYASMAWPATGNFYQWDGSLPEPAWHPNPEQAVDLDTEQKGVYAASRFAITEQVKLIAGGRYTEWQRSGLNYGAALDFGDDKFVPYIGLTYQVAGNHMLYASHTEIFTPQNAYDRNGNFLDAIVGSNQELGVKSSFLDGAVQTAVAVFRIEQDNLAQADAAYNDPANNFFPSFAARGSESKGFELELIGRINDSWNLSAGYAQFTAEDRDGVDINANHPRKKLNVFSTYEFTDALAGLTLGGGLSWESESYSDVIPLLLSPQTYQVKQGSFVLANLMARYDINKQLSVQLNVHNLFDETYYNGLTQQYNYGAPRNFSLGVNYAF